MKDRIIYQTLAFTYENVSREDQVKEYLAVMEDRVYSVDEVKKAEEVTDEDLQNFQYEESIMNSDDERQNLNMAIETDILAVASLGLWNGRRMGYKMLGKNLNNIFNVWDSCEEIKLYSDGKDVKGIGHHHDGTNYVTFRAWKKNVSEAKKEEVLKSLYNNQSQAEALVKKYTRSIHKDIKSIYGW